MRNPSKRIAEILIVAATFAAQQTPAGAQTPAPAAFTQFPLPLADKSTATAIILPAPDGRAYLIYSSAGGRTAILYISPGPSPPDVVPPPPVPVKLRIAVIEDPLTTSQSQRALLTDPKWRTPAATNHSLVGIIPYNLVQPDTGKAPPSLRFFLEAAAGKPLPRLIIARQDDTALYNELLPATAEAVIALLKKFGG